MASIRQIWAIVAEKFSPFNIDVTTVDPGSFGNTQALHVVIGGDGAWTGGNYGGMSYVSSFYNYQPNVVYVFPAHLAGNPLYIADAIAHESGHSFSLNHQSLYTGDNLAKEYNPGSSSKAPIMGLPYSSARAVWWYGPNQFGASTVQDDLAKISRTNNGFGYRPDDHGNDSAHATPLTIYDESISASGIIEQMTDADYFSFTTTGGTASFTVNVAQYGAMLHAKAEIHDAGDNVIVSAADANTLGQTLSANLATGTYYLVIKSYGEYGDLGQYTVTGTLPSAGPVAPIADAGGFYTVAEGGTIQLNGSASIGTNLNYAWDLDGDGLFGETGVNALYGDEIGPTPTFNATGLDGPSSCSVTLKVTDTSGNFSTATATISIIDVPPTVKLSGPASAKQDTSYTLNLSATDPGPDTISNWIINWGDGSSDTITDGHMSVDHVYRTRGQYTITATATNEDGTYTTDSLNVTVRSPYPTATATPADITTFAGSTHDFMVTYSDDLGINPTTLDDNDIRVTGPNGFDQLAIFISATNDAATGTCAAVYRIAAPAGSWDASDNGAYTLTLQADQVANTAGDLAPSSALADFKVDAPAFPAASAGGPYTVTEGGALQLDGAASTGMDLTYAWDLDGDGVFGEAGAAATRGDETGPNPTFQAVALNGPSTYSVYLQITDIFNNTAITAVDIAVTNTPPLLTIIGDSSVKVETSYTLNLSASDPGLDTISKWIIGWGDGSTEQITDGRTSLAHVYHTRGQYQITASAIDDDGTYEANNLSMTVRSAFPTAVANAIDVRNAGGSSYQFTVVYSDDLGIDLATLDDNDIRVTDPGGFGQLAAFVSAVTNASTCTATYRIMAPGGMWDASDNGTYILTLQANQVANTAGDLTPSNTLGSFLASMLPLAKAGGPYTVAEGGTFQLNGLSSTGTNLAYAWDLDGDGLFGETGPNATHGDEAGPTPIFRVTGLDGPSTYPVSLRVTDGIGNTSTATASINITNVPPTLLISGAAAVKQSSSYTLNLSASDPGIDVLSKWIINWDDGSSDTITDSRSTALHVYSTRGQYKITASVIDEDGTYQTNSLNVTVRSPFPSAVANPSSVSMAGETGYSFTIIYSDDAGVDVATLDDSDVLITGPEDFTQLATFVSAATNGITCTAAYQIAAPGGSWDTADNGTYTLTLQDGQVRNTLGDVAPSAVLADFQVAIATLPTAHISGPYTVAEGGTVQLSGSSSTGTNLTYAWDLDGDGLFGETGAAATRGDETGPTPTFRAIGLDGPSTYLAILNVTDHSNNVATATATINIANVAPTLSLAGDASVKQGSDYILNLSASDPGADIISKWIIVWGDGTSEEITDGRTAVPHTYATRGQYTITASAIDDDGTYSANDLTIAVKGSFPRATTSLDDITVSDSSSQRFTIIYADDFGLDVATLDSADILITGPNAFSQLATFVSAEEDLNTGSYIAVYQIDAPDGTWNPADNGTYTVTLLDGQVSNLMGYAAPAATLATFEIGVPETDVTPPTAAVRASGISHGGETSYTFSVTYRDDAALNINALNGNEILVRGPNRYRQSASLVAKSPSIDGKSCIVTYRITAPGGFWDPTDSGNYWLQANAGQVTDAAANALPAGPLGPTINVNIADDGAATALKRSRLLKLPASGKSRTQTGFLIGTNSQDYYWFSIATQTRLNAALSNMVGNAQLQILNKSGRVVQPIRKYAGDPHAFSNYLAPGIYYIRIARVGTRSTGYDLQLSTIAGPAISTMKAAKASAFSLQAVVPSTPTPSRGPLVLSAGRTRPTSLFSQEDVAY
ncbi:MAG: PKD domain-containing protein [Bacillota bacterium]